MTIALSSDFIPHMVYKWRKSAKGNLEGYIRWSVTAFNTSDWWNDGTWTGPGPDIIIHHDNETLTLTDQNKGISIENVGKVTLSNGTVLTKMPEACYFKAWRDESSSGEDKYQLDMEW